MDRHWRYLRIGIIGSDVVAVFLAYRLAGSLRFGLAQISVGGALWPVYRLLAGAVALLTVGLAWWFGTYRRRALLGGHRVYPLLLAVATYNLIAVMILSYLLGGPPLVSRSWLLASWLATIVLLSGCRFGWRRVALRWQRKGYLVRNVLIAGANQHGIAIAEQLRDPGAHGRRVVGFLDDWKRPGTEVLPGIPVVGHPSSLLEVADDLAAEEVILVADALTWESERELAELVTSPAFPLDARLSPTYYDLLTTSAELSHIAYVPMLTLQRARLSGLNGPMKALGDVGVSSALLLLLFPAFLYWRIKAWALRVPMLRREPVLGFGGKSFDVVGLNPRLVRSPVTARLPALWNVVRRQLSLVGPRPVRACELGSHERWLANLSAMRPGLSGLWRIRGREGGAEERVAVDLYYIRNYTLSLDVQVVTTTARQLVRRAFGRPYELGRWLSAEAEAQPSSPPDVEFGGTNGGPVPDRCEGSAVASAEAHS